jgi:hypothetical protein
VLLFAPGEAILPTNVVPLGVAIVGHPERRSW